MKRLALFILLLLIGGAIGLSAGYYAWHTNPEAVPVGTNNPTTNQGDQISSCSPSSLTLSYATDEGGGTAGSVYGTLTFRNGGSSICTISGHPTVALTAANGTMVGQTAAYDASIDAQNGASGTLTVLAGQTVKAGVRFTSSAGGSCVSGASKLEVVLPGKSGYLTVPVSQSEWCPGFSNGNFYRA